MWVFMQTLAVVGLVNGTIENANKLIRQNISNDTDIWTLNDSFVSDIQAN